MKYLEKSFTFYPGLRAPKGTFQKIYDRMYPDAEQCRRDHIRDKQLPHEFEGANMCQICGLDGKAKIHERAH